MLWNFENPQDWLMLGIPVLFITASFMHFIYEWSGKLLIVGIFAPINESVWEHLKMTFWPMVIWWVAGYSIIGQSTPISASQWFMACTSAVLICPLIIISFYYTYTGALGIQSLILDIFSLFLGLAASQLWAFHLYKHLETGQTCLFISLIILLLAAFSFTMFTFNPPHLPLFLDSQTGNYGLHSKQH